MRLRNVVLVAAGLMSTGLMARADTTYQYTGKDFTEAEGLYTTSDSVNGTFTLASGLGDNAADEIVTPAAWSFSDGVHTVSNVVDPSETIEFAFWTNASGAITEWTIQLLSASGGPNIMTVNDPGKWVEDVCGPGAGNYGVNGNDAGKITVVAATPEPGGLLLLGTGLLALAGIARKRFA